MIIKDVGALMVFRENVYFVHNENFVVYQFGGFLLFLSYNYNFVFMFRWFGLFKFQQDY